MHYYRIYGLKIMSEIPLRSTDLPPFDKVDVEVVANNEIEDLPGSVKYNHFRFDRKGNVLFETDYYMILVTGGERIEFKVKETGTDLIDNHITGSCLGIILMQRKRLVLHASAVVKENEALLFCGPSGNGKSTTASLFQQRGYHLVSDDVAAITWRDDIPHVHAGLPIQKITSKVLTAMGSPASDDEVRVYYEPSKYFRSAVALEHVSVPIKHIYILRKGDKPFSYMEELDELSKFHLLYCNSYRFGMIKLLGFAKGHLELCKELFQSVDISCVYYPRDSMDLDQTLSIFQH